MGDPNVPSSDAMKDSDCPTESTVVTNDVRDLGKNQLKVVFTFFEVIIVKFYYWYYFWLLLIFILLQLRLVDDFYFFLEDWKD